MSYFVRAVSPDSFDVYGPDGRSVRWTDLFADRSDAERFASALNEAHEVGRRSADTDTAQVASDAADQARWIGVWQEIWRTFPTQLAMSKCIAGSMALVALGINPHTMLPLRRYS